MRRRIIVDMHTTTVRFAEDTWAQLREAAELAGVPVAQFVREAAIARIVTADLVDLRERVRLLEAQVWQLRRIVRHL